MAAKAYARRRFFSFFGNFFMEVKKEMPPSEKPKVDAPLLNVWALAGEIGLIIALPLVLLLLAGIKLDKIFNTTPVFICLSLVFSMTISSVAIFRKVKRLS